MQEQLISQETFKLTKSKGCILKRCICGGFPECICTDKRITQSLLAKWLREKHNIYIIVLPGGNNNWGPQLPSDPAIHCTSSIDSSLL